MSKWLKAGGKVLITDYCRSSDAGSPEFTKYIKQRGYDLHDVTTYGQVTSIFYFQPWMALCKQLACLLYYTSKLVFKFILS